MISQLQSILNSLSGSEKTLFKRIYSIYLVENHFEIFRPERTDAFENKVPENETKNRLNLKVLNLITLENTVFNIEKSINFPYLFPFSSSYVSKERGEEFQYSSFLPDNQTASDSFGSIKGVYSSTNPNLLKLDVWHTEITFEEKNPLIFGEPQVMDYFKTALDWAKAVNKIDPKAIYFFFSWDSYWDEKIKSNSSKAQVCLGREMHYGKIERLRRDAKLYSEKYNKNYFDDLKTIHKVFGLSIKVNKEVDALVYLTPHGDKEIVLLSNAYSVSLFKAIFEVLSFYKDQGIQAFNLMVQMPPIIPIDEDWKSFPILVNIIGIRDSNNIKHINETADLLGSSISTSDPFNLARDFNAWITSYSNLD